jgi:hypothetical protein
MPTRRNKSYTELARRAATDKPTAEKGSRSINRWYSTNAKWSASSTWDRNRLCLNPVGVATVTAVTVLTILVLSASTRVLYLGQWTKLQTNAIVSDGQDTAAELNDLKIKYSCMYPNCAVKFCTMSPVRSQMLYPSCSQAFT